HERIRTEPRASAFPGPFGARLVRVVLGIAGGTDRVRWHRQCGMAFLLSRGAAACGHRPAHVRPVAIGFIPKTGTPLAQRARPRENFRAHQRRPEPVRVLVEPPPRLVLLQYFNRRPGGVGVDVSLHTQYRAGSPWRDATRRNIAPRNALIHLGEP